LTSAIGGRIYVSGRSVVSMGVERIPGIVSC
jgi:hypothetical protein